MPGPPPISPRLGECPPGLPSLIHFLVPGIPCSPFWALRTPSTSMWVPGTLILRRGSLTPSMPLELLPTRPGLPASPPVQVPLTPTCPSCPVTHARLLPLEVAEELLFLPGLVHVRWPVLSGLLRDFGPLVGTVVSHGKAGHHLVTRWGSPPPLPCPLVGDSLPWLCPRGATL